MTYFRFIVRFSHVFFVSTCCHSSGRTPIVEEEGIEAPSTTNDDEENSEQEYHDVSLD